MNINKKSFTLIELMIVVIIVGVLAAVAAPMMRRAVIRAKWAEAIAALGTIRVAERVYYTEYSTYLEFDYGHAAEGLPALGLRLTDFDGIYFTNNCYAFHLVSSIRAECYLNLSISPKANALNFNNAETAKIYLNGTLAEDY